MRVFVINAGVKRPDGSGGWLNAEMTRMAKEAFERRKIESTQAMRKRAPMRRRRVIIQ